MISRVDQMLSDMREYEKHLDSELRRVRRILHAADGVEVRTNTTEMLLELFQENPGDSFTAAEAEEEIRQRGWMTESADPVNAVRAALTRLKNNNEIESVGRGRFQLREESSESSYDPWSSDPPVPRQKSTLQPATAVPHADDEPPF